MEDIVKSVNGVPIRLTSERWNHIIKRHAIHTLRKAVLQTIQDPVDVYVPYELSHKQYMARNTAKHLAINIPSDNLVVHYRELSPSDGFIITAHLMSAQRFRRMKAKWKKVYP